MRLPPSELSTTKALTPERRPLVVYVRTIYDLFRLWRFALRHQQTNMHIEATNAYQA
jgi:hypothetical protein